MQVQVTWRLRDYNGLAASMTMYPPDDEDHADIVARLNSLLPKAAAITTAAIEGVSIRYTIENSDASEPEPTSDVYTRAILLFRNGTDAGSISVPSPYNLPTDGDGPYRLIRITREALVLSGLLANLQNIVSGTARPDGLPFPEDYTVGCIARVRP